MKRVEITLEDYMIGFEALSIVDFPAIEENFIALSKQPIHLAKMIEGRLVGPVLIPDMDILRFDEKTQENYTIFFSQETVKKIAYQMMKESKQGKFTVQHEGQIDNAAIVESWIIEDEATDKSKLYGFDLPKGTHMAVVELSNPMIKAKIESGQLRGFSIEFNASPKKEVESFDLDKYLKSLIND